MRLIASVVVGCVIALVLGPGVALANGFYVPEVGVKAASMGAAFMGLADDFSAIHYNPAGITQIEGVEVTVRLADAMPMASREGRVLFRGATDYHIPVSSEIEATADLVHHWAPGFYAYTDVGSWKLGAGAYTVAEYGSKWSGQSVWDDLIEDYATLPDDPAGYRKVMGAPPDYDTSVKAYMISAALAKEFAPGISVGVTGHALYSHWKVAYGGWHEISYAESSEIYPWQFEEDATGWSFGATIGFLWRATEFLSIGATGRLPISVDHDGWVKIDSDVPELQSPKQNEKFEMTYAPWYGGGIAYRDFLMEGLTVTADAHWTQWSELQKITRVTSEELPGDTNVTEFLWEDTWEFGIGFDYRLSRSISLRLGYRNQPNPAPDSTYNFALPQTDKSIIGLGVGWRQDVWTVDFGLVYQLSDERTIEQGRILDPNNQLGKHLEDVIIPSFSLTYGF
jgi:long-chain fatty acid transport protein